MTLSDKLYFSILPNDLLISLFLYFDSKELLIIQLIQSRWKNFYNLLINAEDKNDFRKRLINEISKYVKLDEDERIKILDTDEIKQEEKEEYDSRIRKILGDFKLDTDLWKVLEHIDLIKIKDWNIYRRATEVGIEPTEIINPIDINNDAYKLLKAGKILEFNRKRSKEFSVLNLRNTNLSEIDLRGIDLEEANLKNAILKKTILRDSILKNAILRDADLSSTDLQDADLTRADLTGTNLIETNLEGIFIEGTDFSNSIIIHPDIRNYETLLVNEATKFYEAVIDDPQFINYISRFTKNIPFKISNKKELKVKLEEKLLQQEKIKKLLAISKLPE